jgi:ketosteroid isomerase-like protein
VPRPNLIVVLGLLGCGLSAETEAQCEEVDIQQRIQAYQEAVGRRDLAEVVTFYVDTVTVLRPEFLVRGKAKAESLLVLTDSVDYQMRGTGRYMTRNDSVVTTVTRNRRTFVDGRTEDQIRMQTWVRVGCDWLLVLDAEMHAPSQAIDSNRTSVTRGRTEHRRFRLVGPTAATSSRSASSTPVTSLPARVAPDDDRLAGRGGCRRWDLLHCREASRASIAFSDAQLNSHGPDRGCGLLRSLSKLTQNNE